MHIINTENKSSPIVRPGRIRVTSIQREQVIPSNTDTDRGHFRYAPPSNPKSQYDLEFEQQKRLFERLSPEELEPYQGEFVASRNGRIVGHDTDIVALTSWFFAEHGNVAVYMTRIGEPVRITLRTPLL
jgi:hypothetical protein